MKMTLLAIVVILAALPLAAATYKNVPIVDAGCLDKVRDDPDAHTKSCALQCAKSGYGVLSDGAFLAFDEKGNELALAAFKSLEKKNHIRANVTGEVKDGVLHVTALTLE